MIPKLFIASVSYYTPICKKIPDFPLYLNNSVHIWKTNRNSNEEPQITTPKFMRRTFQLLICSCMPCILKDYFSDSQQIKYKVWRLPSVHPPPLLTSWGVVHVFPMMNLHQHFVVTYSSQFTSQFPNGVICSPGLDKFNAKYPLVEQHTHFPDPKNPLHSAYLSFLLPPTLTVNFLFTCTSHMLLPPPDAI